MKKVFDVPKAEFIEYDISDVIISSGCTNYVACPTYSGQECNNMKVTCDFLENVN